MNSSVWLIAWRYLWGSRREQSVSTMAKICFLGILVGSCSLALVTAIMEGFEQTTHEKMQGIHAQLIIKNGTDALNVAAISHVLSKEFPEVVAFSPQRIGQVIINTHDDQDLTNVVMIKGIEPTLESQTSCLESKIIGAACLQKLTAIMHDDSIMIGTACAKALHVQIGDKVNLTYVISDAQHSQRINVASKTAIVGGTYKTGIEEFDASLIFCSQSLFDQLFPDQGVSQLSLKLKPGTDEKTVKERLAKRLQLEVYSWKDLYPALVAALKLEKYVMFFILALITLVACMNLISLLFMHIIQKRADIAILQSIGMQTSDINMIFLIMGLILTSISSLVGLTLAWLIGLLLEHYPIIQLPDVYYVSTLPVYLDIRIFATIFLFILLISIIAIWLPIRSIKQINTAQTLRHDA